MKVMKKRFFLCIAVALVALSIFPQLSSATLVWSETFEGSEIDSEIWSTTYGQLEDGCLRGVAGQGESLYRNSTVSVGTWKLELTKMNDWTSHSLQDFCRVYLLTTDAPSLSSEYLSLSLKQAFSGDEESTSYNLDKYSNGAHSFLATYMGQARETIIGVLHRFTITRTSGGVVSVKLNDTPILQATITDISSTQYFGFYTRDDWALDNIFVDDTPEVGGYPLIMIVAGVGISVVVIAIVVFFVRRK